MRKTRRDGNKTKVLQLTIPSTYIWTVFPVLSVVNAGLRVIICSLKELEWPMAHLSLEQMFLYHTSGPHIFTPHGQGLSQEHSPPASYHGNTPGRGTHSQVLTATWNLIPGYLEWYEWASHTWSVFIVPRQTRKLQADPTPPVGVRIEGGRNNPRRRNCCF